MQQGNQSTAGGTAKIGGLGAAVKIPGSATEGAYAVVEHTLAPGTLGAPPHQRLSAASALSRMSDITLEHIRFRSSFWKRGETGLGM